MAAEKAAEGIAGLTEKRREASSNYIEGEGDVICFGNGHLLICNAVYGPLLNTRTLQTYAALCEFN